MELVSLPHAGSWSPSKVLVQILQMPAQPVEYAPSCLEPRWICATPVVSHSAQSCLPVTALSPIGDFVEIHCRNKLRSSTSTEKKGAFPEQTQTLHRWEPAVNPMAMVRITCKEMEQTFITDETCSGLD